MTHSNTLLQYLDAQLVSVNSDVSSPKKLLQEMARLLASPLETIEDENNEKAVYRSLLEREKLGNTGIGNGVALPHSRFDGTSRAVIAIITLSESIDYDSPDGQPVDLAFGLLVPREATQEHLSLLADIARLMSQKDNKDQLLSAEDSQQVINLINSWSQPG